MATKKHPNTSKPLPGMAPLSGSFPLPSCSTKPLMARTTTQKSSSSCPCPCPCPQPFPLTPPAAAAAARGSANNS